MGAVFSRATRVLACDRCGAPLPVDLQGGAYRCPYCQATNQVSQRREAAAREGWGAPSVTEGERLQRLREQDAKAWHLPTGLEQYELGSELPPELLKSARDKWMQARRGLQAGGAFSEAERLFHLTLVLVPSLPAQEQRAFLESAIEALPDEGFRQVLRCRLAQAAALAGDLEAAEAWLGLVDPRPLLLLTDSAYRLAASSVLRARRKFAQVLGLLGQQPGEVPLLDAFELEAVLLRCDAWEQTGELSSATEALARYLSEHARAVHEVQRRVQGPAAGKLCPRASARAVEQVWEQLDGKLRPRSATGFAAASAATGTGGSALLIITAAVLWPVFTGQESFSCEKNSNGAIAVNTMIWGTILLLAFVALVALAIAQKRLRNTGIHAYVRVLTSSSRTLQTKQGTATMWDLKLELATPSGVHRSERSVRQEQPIAPGYYPCVVAASDPQNRNVWFGAPDMKAVQH